MTWNGLTATWNAGSLTLTWSGDPYAWPPDSIVSEWAGTLVVALAAPSGNQRTYQLAGAS